MCSMTDVKISGIIYLDLEPHKDKASEWSSLQRLVFQEMPSSQMEHSVSPMAREEIQPSQKGTDSTSFWFVLFSFWFPSVPFLHLGGSSLQPPRACSRAWSPMQRRPHHCARSRASLAPSHCHRETGTAGRIAAGQTALWGCHREPGCLCSAQQKPTLGISREAQAAYTLFSVNIQPELVCSCFIMEQNSTWEFACLRSGSFPLWLLGVLMFAVSTGPFKSKRSNCTTGNGVSGTVGQTWLSTQQLAQCGPRLNLPLHRYACRGVSGSVSEIQTHS